GALRVDRGLAERLPLSRSRVQGLIEDGRVEMDGAVVERASAGVAAGAVVVVRVPPKRASTLTPEAIPLDVLWEDARCLVIDKPAGLVVHPAPGHLTGTLVHALLHLRPEVSGVGGERKAGLVHRLDKDTSGCLLVAKDDAAHAALSAQFAERAVKKLYRAWTWGHLGARSGVVDAAIGRSLRDRQRMSTRTRRGRSAVTRWRVIESYDVAEELEIDLETGRTHQIRVHLSEAGHPVIGDARYGGGPARARGFHGPQEARARRVAGAAPRQALHARALTFDPPGGGARVEVVSPLPADLERLRTVLAGEA
ncbi:MAG TPA: RluA family pseudouridine synthase, partial [Gemmatimonadota bacterium]|nr:RluA family pseudouridine synthase [Gemmatimonadota bacterium]